MCVCIYTHIVRVCMYVCTYVHPIYAGPPSGGSFGQGAIRRGLHLGVPLF